MSKLVDFLERKNFQRFSNLKPDEKLIAHWALSFKELIKFNFSSFYGYDLDNIELSNQMRCTSSDKKGGINYFNYMFSDQYDDKDKKIDDKGQIFAALSVYEALEKYGAVSIGDFVCPPDVLAYVKQAKQNGDFGESNIPRDQKRYDDCKKICEDIIRKDKRLQGHPIICLVGAMWVECSWAFGMGVYNVDEYRGNTSSSFASGKLNCGETWFGLTNWGQKCNLINQMKSKGYRLDVNMNAGSYDPAGSNAICRLPLDQQADIYAYYHTEFNKQFGEYLIDYNKNPKTMNTARDAICASYLIKAGCWLKSGTLWDKALDARDRYRATHEKKYNKSVDGFGLQIYMSLMFAKFLKDKKVPKGDPWD